MRPDNDRRRTSSGQRWVLALSSIASFMVVLDMLVVATALSSIQRDLGASLQDLEWTVNAYTVAFAVLIMTGATLGDRYGRRRMFAVGLGLFSLASAACALAQNTTGLVAARAVQGAGAALIMPLALGLLNAAFPPERRGWAMGVYGSVTGLAATVGPLVGGALTQGIGWQWVFWINLPIGLVSVPLVLARVPESRGPATNVDLPGIVLAGGAALGLMWALVRGNTVGWASAETLVALSAGAVLGVAFVVSATRVAAPMLPLHLFRARPFSVGNLVILLINASLSGALFFTAQFYQVAEDESPFMTGLRLLPWGLPPLLIAARTGALADRIGERPLLVAGGLSTAVGMGWLALAGDPGTGYLPMMGASAFGGLGIALALPAVTRSVVSRVAPPDMGKASGTFSTMRQLGGAFGVAVAGAVFAASGGYGSPTAFGDGYRPAMTATAALALLAALVGAIMPGSARGTPSGRATDVAPGRESGVATRSS